MTINLSTFLGSTFQGSAGIQGTTGSQGVLGIQGNIGSQGTQGVQGLSNQGTSGSQGIQGLSGSQGSQGTQGVQGLSNQGTSGSQGIQGLSGSQGSQGTQGVQGLSNQGTSGSQGIQGSIGIQGASLVGIPSSSNTTIVSTDAGKHLNINANITINSSTGFSIGDMCTIYNNGTTTRTITPTGITLRLAGTGSTGTRYLSQRGLGNILCVASNDYVVSGAGLT